MHKKIIGLLVSIFFIVLILHQIDLNKSFAALKSFNLSYIPLIIPVYYLAFIFRSYRWKIILSEYRHLKIRSLISSLFIGFTANAILPARMGEFYRAHLFGKKEDIKRGTVFASIILERIIDGTVLFLMLLFLIYFLYSKPWLFKLATVVGFIFVGGFIFLLLFAKFGRSEVFLQKSGILFLKNLFNICLTKLPYSVQNLVDKSKDGFLYLLHSFIDGLDIFHHPTLLFKTFLLTILVWLCEGATMMLVIKSFGISINLFSALFVMCVTAFSTMIPAGPASIGPYQWGYILALSVFAVNKDVAFTVSIINQLIAIILISAAGLYFMWKDHINIKEIEEDIELKPEIIS